MIYNFLIHAYKDTGKKVNLKAYYGRFYPIRQTQRLYLA